MSTVYNPKPEARILKIPQATAEPRRANSEITQINTPSGAIKTDQNLSKPITIRDSAAADAATHLLHQTTTPSRLTIGTPPTDAEPSHDQPARERHIKGEDLFIVGLAKGMTKVEAGHIAGISSATAYR